MVFWVLAKVLLYCCYDVVLVSYMVAKVVLGPCRGIPCVADVCVCLCAFMLVMLYGSLS